MSVSYVIYGPIVEVEVEMSKFNFKYLLHISFNRYSNITHHLVYFTKYITAIKCVIAVS